MSRTIQDANLEIWEAYASAGEFGFPERSKILFHCLSDRTRRARALQREEDRAAVEHAVATLSDAELMTLLERATDVK
ncbi:MAG TPA: hypothetical protein VMM12_12870 [Longimicrobiales bacterium]|nr:hypothetical protein [Longimicrobiales bacterium]